MSRNKNENDQMKDNKFLKIFKRYSLCIFYFKYRNFAAYRINKSLKEF